MSHKKFYSIVGLLSFGCGLLSLVSILMYGWVLNGTSIISKARMKTVSRHAFGLSVMMTLMMFLLSWLYGEKHVARWKAWHALGILMVGAVTVAVPWVAALLYMKT